jgi:hypothetical protein
MKFCLIVLTFLVVLKSEVLGLKCDETNADYVDLKKSILF